MMKLGSNELPYCLYIFLLFLRAGLFGGASIFLLVWFLVPEQTMAGRVFFALIGFFLFVAVGVVQSIICYRTNKSHAAEKKVQEP
jgi:hypothetical protein